MFPKKMWSGDVDFDIKHFIEKPEYFFKKIQKFNKEDLNYAKVILRVLEKTGRSWFTEKHRQLKEKASFLK